MFKRYFLYIFFLFFFLNGVFSKDLGIGSFIHDEFQKVLQANLLSDPKTLETKNGWSDLIVTAMGSKQGEIFLTAKLQWKVAFPYGFMREENNHYWYYYDLNGDKIIETKSDILVVPFYFYLIYGDINSGKEPGLIELLDLFYSIFQGDMGPGKDPRTKKIGEILGKVKKNTEIQNRDLYYALWFYITYNQLFFRHSMEIMDYFMGELSSRYGKVHPLPLLFSTETFINVKFIPTARGKINAFLKQYPDFIPMKVYDFRYNTPESDKKEIKFKVLKKEHPEHWIVKQLSFE